MMMTDDDVDHDSDDDDDDDVVVSYEVKTVRHLRVLDETGLNLGDPTDASKQLFVMRIAIRNRFKSSNI